MPLAALAIGLLAALAAAPLQGYAWVGMTLIGGGAAAALGITWALEPTGRTRRVLALVFAAWAALPLLLTRIAAGASGGALVMVQSVAPACAVLGVLVWLVRRSCGGGAPRLRAMWALAVLVAAVAPVADVVQMLLLRSSEPAPPVPAWQIWGLSACVGVVVILFAVPLMLLGASLGGAVAARRQWPGRLAARMVGAATLLLVFRFVLAALATGTETLEMLQFRTLGEAVRWWAPGLGAVFALEAVAVRQDGRSLRPLVVAALGFVCLAAAVDRTDPLFRSLISGGALARVPTAQLRRVNDAARYPLWWRPDDRGDDLFGDVDRAREHVWEELARRGEKPAGNPYRDRGAGHL